MDRRSAGKKAELIRAALRERYPCGLIPAGHRSALAAEFGVSREWVRILAHREGLEGQPWTRPRWTCICGRVTHSPEPCLDCRYVELPCLSCGAPVKISVKKLTHRMSRGNRERLMAGYPEYKGNVFCNRVCFGRWLGKLPKKGRAVGPRVRAKTCKRGHPYTKENTYVDRRTGGRRCRTCMKLQYQTRKARLEVETNMRMLNMAMNAMRLAEEDEVIGR